MDDHESEIEKLRKLTELRLRKVISWGMFCLAILVFFIIAAAIFTLGWHMLTPTRYEDATAAADVGPWYRHWHWLGEKEIKTIKDFILSGALVSLALQYFRRFFGDR